MSASLWEPLLVGMMAFLTAVVAVAVLGTFLVWRYGRRKWRAFHSHGLVVGGLALWEATSGRLPRGEDLSPDDVRRLAPRQLRRHLRRSVDRAGEAVRVAEEADAPTGSLPEVCRRLRRVADGLDRVLQVEGNGPVPTDVADQAVEVMRAAADVRKAAVASASDANGQHVADLVRDADQEIRLVDAGLASMRAALPHPER
jgi:hypothetical protein